MTTKIALLLIAVALLASMIGKWRKPKLDRRGGKPVESARKCAVCEAYVMRGSGACGRAECPQA